MNMNRIYKTVLVLALICASISCTNMLEQTDPTARDPNLFPENEVDLNSMLASASTTLTGKSRSCKRTRMTYLIWALYSPAA